MFASTYILQEAQWNPFYSLLPTIKREEPLQVNKKRNGFPVAEKPNSYNYLKLLVGVSSRNPIVTRNHTLSHLRAAKMLQNDSSIPGHVFFTGV